MALKRKKQQRGSSQTLAAVRLRAADERPYFSTALFAMTLVDRPGFGTMGVDQHGRVYVDTTLIGAGKKWTVEQAAYVLLHELGHWLRKHHERCAPLLAGYDRAVQPLIGLLLNECEDAELNDDLEEEGANLPGTTYPTPERLGEAWGVKLERNRLFEEYWAKIKDKIDPKQEPGGGKWGTDGEGGEHGCGSGADGIPRDYELDAPSKTVPGIREAEGDLLRAQVAREIQDHARRNPGTVPGSWVTWAEDQLSPPEVPWERELAALCRNAVTMSRGQVDYSYMKPGRTFNGVIMPSMVRPEPEVGVEIDTSGSMQVPETGRALSEVQGILRSIGQRRCPVVCADAEVQTVKTVSNAFDIEVKGGGGTDMGVGIDTLRDLGCKVIVILTDGATPWPVEAPRDVQLVIGVIGTNEEQARHWAAQAPSYAKRVLIIPAWDEPVEEAS